MSDTRVRVRFAPSPTGPLHIGGVRTALYNYLFAKKHGGDFLLRIEDTDQARYVPGAEEYIIEALKWTGLHYDEGPGINGPCAPYRQSERKDTYRRYADQLVESGHAYYAFDTTADLEEMRERMAKTGMAAPKYDQITREYMKNSLTLPQDEWKARMENGEPYVIRLKVPRNEEIKLRDIIRGWVTVQSNQVDDKVLFKSDGMPTYHLANVVDDYLMKISHVIRGEEWLPSAPLHVLLYKYLGWEHAMPQFAHLPLILRPDGNGKLSKRDGDRLGFPVFPLNWIDPFSSEKTSGYREVGYSSEAFANILVMLGWHPSDNKELFSLEELVDVFTLERVSKSGAKFDPEKAKWYNQQYLRKQDDGELADHFKIVLHEKGIQAPDDYILKVCALIKEKATFLSDFWSLGWYFFIRPENFDKEIISKKWNESAPGFFKAVRDKLDSLNDFTPDTTQAAFEEAAIEKSVKSGQYMQLFRVLLSAEAGGPAIWDLTALIGKQEVVSRLDYALKHFPSLRSIHLQ
ncbi:MAG: glutamate--tRNA ligase [Bacteroidota bacterium]|nr:glutamate--tRNA ligase [Bacteroidota bacterium]